MNYNKPPLSISDQIALLESRGLKIPNRPRTKHYLQHISYYRLRAYTHSFQDNSSVNHPFIVEMTFDEIIELYIFDRELRLLLMDAIERIEIAIRTQIIYEFSMRYDSHWFMDERKFINRHQFKRDFESLEREVNRSTETFIRHYKDKYATPPMPPAWMSLEVTSFGLLSKFYENLKSDVAKKNVAKHFGLGKPIVLESWLHSISFIRNIVAHHGRLWNRVVTKRPMNPRVTHNTWLEDVTVPENKLYFSLCCIQYLLKTVNPTNSFNKRLAELLSKNSKIVNIHDMGFPVNWENEPLWITQNEIQ
jgi:abortive infection bacteriophage resistance protein